MQASVCSAASNGVGSVFVYYCSTYYKAVRVGGGGWEGQQPREFREPREVRGSKEVRGQLSSCEGHEPREGQGVSAKERETKYRCASVPIYMYIYIYIYI